MNKQMVCSPLLMRLTVLTGIILVVLGGWLYFSSGQIIATFPVDIVVSAVMERSVEELPPYEFSWGIKHFGRMNEELSGACVGLLVLSIGQALLLPSLIMRAQGLRKAGMIVSMILIGLSALLFVMVPISLNNAFGFAAEIGAVDPVGFAEMIHVRMYSLSKMALLMAAVIMVLVAMSVLFSRAVEPCSLRISGKLVLAIVSGILLVLFALPFLNLSYGPLSRMSSDSPVEAIELAGYLSTAIRRMIESSVLLGISALLGLISTFLSKKASA